MQALIFDIQRYSVHDGPGIRTTVFFKGCNLRCFWCHNPESYSMQPDLLYYPVKCISCGRCAYRGGFAGLARQIAQDKEPETVCPKGCHTFHQTEEGAKHVFERTNCINCGKCAKACFPGALVSSGKAYDLKTAVKQALQDAPFYQTSGGGVTCSGGEPLLQAEFVAAFFREMQERGIHSALDTAGNVPYEKFEEVLPVTNLILFDLKCMDSKMHREATGASNERILENLSKIGQGNVPVWVRIPVIPTVNDTYENMTAAAVFLKDLPAVERIELLRYHKLGAGKHDALGKPYTHLELPEPSKEQTEKLADCFGGIGKEIIVR
ncbi:MAG: glycyl-radical enzyme activating protein [Oscillospiraceae bacterium]|jgi:pyruvate formate lyase activating enzyme|nr:glycyl-radical enzyme activating protein [Oscillospiraceae bacterium]